MATMKEVNSERRHELRTRDRIDRILTRRAQAINTAVGNVCRKYDKQLLDLIGECSQDLGDRLKADLREGDTHIQVVSEDTTTVFNLLEDTDDPAPEEEPARAPMINRLVD